MTDTNPDSSTRDKRHLTSEQRRLALELASCCRAEYIANGVPFSTPGEEIEKIYGPQY